MYFSLTTVVAVGMAALPWDVSATPEPNGNSTASIWQSPPYNIKAPTPDARTEGTSCITPFCGSPVMAYEIQTTAGAPPAGVDLTNPLPADGCYKLYNEGIGGPDVAICGLKGSRISWVNQYQNALLHLVEVCSGQSTRNPANRIPTLMGGVVWSGAPNVWLAVYSGSNSCGLPSVP